MKGQIVQYIQIRIMRVLMNVMRNLFLTLLIRSMNTVPDKSPIVRLTRVSQFVEIKSDCYRMYTVHTKSPIRKV